MEKTVQILDGDPAARRTLEKLLKKEGLGEACAVLTPEEGKKTGFCIVIGEAPSSGGGHFYFPKPVRAGEVLDQVKRCLSRANAGAEVVSFGAYSLNGLSYELTDGRDGRVIRLTEKEGQILALLARTPGQIISRKALLDDVWRYADGIETHTLETHIYRLRQKIEADPANPALLITEEPGYRLNA